MEINTFPDTGHRTTKDNDSCMISLIVIPDHCIKSASGHGTERGTQGETSGFTKWRRQSQESRETRLGRVHRPRHTEHQTRDRYKEKELQTLVKGSPLGIQLSTGHHVHKRKLSEAGERTTETN